MVQQVEKKNMEISFENLVQQHSAVLDRVLDEHLDVLRSMQAFYDSSVEVGRDEFKTFSAPFLKKFPGLVALDWVPIVSEAEKDQYEEMLKKEGFEDFFFRERDSQEKWNGVKKRPFYFPIIYAEPQATAFQTLGFDLGSDESRLETLKNAARSNEMILSPPRRLFRSEEQDVGFSAFMPVLKKDFKKFDGKNMDRTYSGFIHGAIDLQKLIQSTLLGKDLQQKFSLAIMDDQIPVGVLGEHLAITEKSDSESSKSEMFLVKMLKLPGRNWKVAYRPSPEWIAQNKHDFAIIMLASGIFSTLFLGLYIFSIFGRADAIEQAVKDRTTELAASHQRLELSEKKFRSLVANIPGAVYRCNADKDWTMAFLSESILEIVGYPASDFIENKVRSFASIIHSEDQEMVDHIVWQGIENRIPYIVEYRVVHANGKVRWVYEKGQGVFSEDKKLLWLDGVIVDITEKHQLSEQLLQAQKMDAIGKLAGGVAHDFNNQLTVITGYSDFLLSELSPSDPKYVEVENIKKAAERSSKLNRQLLAFGRKQVMMPKVFNPNLLIEDMEKILSSLLGEKISFTTELSRDLHAIKIDPAQMEQVILNLAMNAKDAMPSGGKFLIQTKNLKIAPSHNHSDLHFPAGDYILLQISDTGTGMSEEVKAHLFEPFFTTKAKNQGSGLGLATCYSVIQANGGVIQVTSEVGKGTTFKIYFPVSLSKPEYFVHQKRSKEVLGGNETILLVEDESSVREIVATILTEKGYQVVQAENGEDALKILHDSGSASFHLLLTDVIMPKMGGRELADKARGLSPKTKILFMSGHTDDAMLLNGVEGGKMNFLQKPFAPRALSAKVREVLDRHHG